MLPVFDPLHSLATGLSRGFTCQLVDAHDFSQVGSIRMASAARPARKVHLDRSFGAAQRRGDPRHVEVEDVVQGDDLRLTTRQFPYLGPERLVLGGERLRVRPSGAQSDHGSCLDCAASQCREGLVRAHPANPSGRRFEPRNLVPVSVGGEHRLLGDVVRMCRPRQGAGEGHERGQLAAVEGLERLWETELEHCVGWILRIGATQRQSSHDPYTREEVSRVYTCGDQSRQALA